MNDHELLVRIDERVSAIKEDIIEIKSQCVTQKEFKPVKAVVFGGVGFMLTSVTVILIRLFIIG